MVAWPPPPVCVEHEKPGRVATGAVGVGAGVGVAVGVAVRTGVAAGVAAAVAVGRAAGDEWATVDCPREGVPAIRGGESTRATAPLTPRPIEPAARTAVGPPSTAATSTSTTRLVTTAPVRGGLVT